MTSSVRLHFFGTPHFERDTETIAFTNAKGIALLAYLVLHKGGHPREKIITLLWSESAEEAARKNLRNLLWAIRKAFGEIIITDPMDRITIAENVWSDVTAFEEQTESADLFTSPFLDGLTLSEAPDLDVWIANERERLTSLYLKRVESRLPELQRTKQWDAVIASAQRILAFDPLREPVTRIIMAAYIQLGDRAEALRQYDVLKSSLSRELGVAPLAETEALRALITNGDGSEGSNGNGVASATSALALNFPRQVPARQALSVELLKVPFTGRKAELLTLNAELQQVKEDHARIVFVGGELGIGKSRLWSEWASTIPPEVLVIQSRCLASTQNLPLAPLTDLFSTRMCQQQIVASNMPSFWVAEIARFFPELRDQFPELPAPATLPPEEERHRLFEAFVQILLTMMDQDYYLPQNESRSKNPLNPLVVFIDDIHWADRALLDWLDFVVHRLQNYPLMLVSTYRPTDAPAALAALMAGWGREGLVTKIMLPRLTMDDTRELVNSLGVESIRAYQVQLQSAGNPYFLIELARASDDLLPPTLIDLLKARLDRLPDTARQIAQAAAVLGGEFSLNALEKVSGRSEDETLDALDILLKADMFTERKLLYSFSHPLVGTAVHNTLSGARRAVLHRRAAMIREQENAAHLNLIAGSLVEHYKQAGDFSQAAHYADLAAEYALSIAAPTEAESFYKQAYTLEPTARRLLGAGVTRFWQNDSRGAIAAFHAAMDAFQREEDEKGMAEACLHLAEACIPNEDAEQMKAWVDRALTLLNGEADPRSMARAQFLYGVASLAGQQSLDEAQEHLTLAYEIASANHLTQQMGQARFELGNLLAQRGDLSGAVDAFVETIQIGKVNGDLIRETLGYNNAAYHSLLMGETTKAREYADAGLALAESRAISLPLQYLYSTRGEIALAESDWDTAELWFQRGLKVSMINGNNRQAANYRANLGLTARGRGDLDTAILLFDEAAENLHGHTSPHLQTQIDLWLTETYLERGEVTAANESLKNADARLTGSGRQRLMAWANELREKIAHLANYG